MSTVRVYYSREDQDYDNYTLWYMPGRHMGDPNLLFPENTYEDFYHEAPRSEIEFTSEGSFGYADIDLNGAKYCDFFIRRKDFLTNYNAEDCEGNTVPCGAVCGLCLESGYKFTLTENMYDVVYVKEDKPYLYRDTFFQAIVAQKITPIGNNSNNVSDDLLHDTVEHGEQGEDLLWSHYKIFNTYKNSTTIEIPQSVQDNVATMMTLDMDSTMSYLMLYLCGKTYTIGEDMQLSIDADALAVEKADALQMIDKAIANSLYKLGEVPADFDEDAFLADTATYKAGKSEVLGPTVDYLKELLTTRPNLV